MKPLLLILAVASLALAEEKKIPEVPQVPALEMKLEAEKAQKIYWQLEALKAQYNQLLEEQQRTNARFEVKREAIFTKAGVKKEEFDLNADATQFTRKPQAAK